MDRINAIAAAQIALASAVVAFRECPPELRGTRAAIAREAQIERRMLSWMGALPA